jgi:hypothetical protein
VRAPFKEGFVVERRRHDGVALGFKLRVCLVWFQIHCESKIFYFLLRNNSRSNQDHHVKSFDQFVKMFQIQ